MIALLATVLIPVIGAAWAAPVIAVASALFLMAGMFLGMGFCYLCGILKLED